MPMISSDEVVKIAVIEERPTVPFCRQYHAFDCERDNLQQVHDDI